MKNVHTNGRQDFLTWNWEDIAPIGEHLLDYEINSNNIDHWLKEYSDLLSVIDEMFTRLYIKTTQYTNDPDIEARFNEFIEQIQPKFRALDEKLQKKLLSSGIKPKNFDIPMKKIQAENELFCEENLPLLVEEQKLAYEYNKIIGGLTHQWEGKELTTSEMNVFQFNPDRSVREKAWRVVTGDRLKKRDEINVLWSKMVKLRVKIAKNKGFENYRDYVWQKKYRFDYSPTDCKTFHDSIEKVIVLAAKRLYARRAQRMSIPSIRPWDLFADPYGDTALKPFSDTAELISKGREVLRHVDPVFAEYFDQMRADGRLDLESRKHKAPGAYSLGFAVERTPFIFMSASGTQNDVSTLLHESGHAIHEVLRGKLEYFQDRSENFLPAEFAEVASMAMEFLTTPFVNAKTGGFYNDKDAARAFINQIEESLRFWPYMSVVDSFQHWIYENPEISVDGEQCELKWAELWNRYMGAIDYSGEEVVKQTYWHRQLHIFDSPFYYIEYGVAQMGAVQVWANSLTNYAKAVENYTNALKLGSSVGLPKLFEAAGAKFDFGVDTIQQNIALMETKLEELVNTLDQAG